MLFLTHKHELLKLCGSHLRYVLFFIFVCLYVFFCTFCLFFSIGRSGDVFDGFYVSVTWVCKCDFRHFYGQYEFCTVVGGSRKDAA